MGRPAGLRADRRGGTSPSSSAAYTSPISRPAGSVADRAVVGTRTAYTSLAARAPYSERHGVTESFRVLGSIATGRASASKKAMSKQAECPAMVCITSEVSAETPRALACIVGGETRPPIAPAGAIMRHCVGSCPGVTTDAMVGEPPMCSPPKSTDTR